MRGSEERRVWICWVVAMFEGFLVLVMEGMEEGLEVGGVLDA